MIKDFKVSLLIAVVATIINFAVLLIAANTESMNVGMVICCVVTLIALILAGGLKLFIKAVTKGFFFGMMIPIFPANFIIGGAIAILAFGFSVFFPIIPILLNQFVDKIDA